MQLKLWNNLLFAGHISDVRSDVEKKIFKVFSVEEIYALLDDEDIRVVDQTKLIFRNLMYNYKDDGFGSGDKSSSILSTVKNETMMNRIKEEAKCSYLSTNY